MPIFQDTKNTEWTIDINVGSIKRVLSEAKINLSLPHEPDEHGTTLCDRIVSDLMLQVDVIWALVKPQAESLGVTIEEFCERCKPQVMAKAYEEFFEAWIDFFRKLGRDPIAEAMIQARALQKEMSLKAIEQLNRLKEAQSEAMTVILKSTADQAIAEVAKLKTAGLPPVPVVTSLPSSASAIESPEGSESATLNA